MKFKDNSGFIYELNERDSTASIVKLTQKVKDIIIPTFIEYENKKYIITIIESNPAIPKRTNAYISIFHSGNFSCPANALLSEYTPFSFLLADKITANSIGTNITVPKIQNSGICSMLQKYPNNK